MFMVLYQSDVAVFFSFVYKNCKSKNAEYSNL